MRKTQILALIFLVTISVLTILDLTVNSNRNKVVKFQTEIITGRVMVYVSCPKEKQSKRFSAAEEPQYYIDINQQNSIKGRNAPNPSYSVPVAGGQKIRDMVGAMVTLEGYFVPTDETSANKINLAGKLASKQFVITRIISVAPEEITNLAPTQTSIKKIAIVAFKFTDTTESVPPATNLQNPLVNTNRSLKGYLTEAMRNRVALVSGPSDVYGWYDIPFSSVGCGSNSITWRDAARNMAQAEAITRGIDFTTYSHVIYIFPATDCPWAGSASLGLGVDSPFQLTIWIPLRTLEDLGQVVPVLPHEFGHTFSLANHPGKSDCFGSVSATCTRQSNGAVGSPMGVSRLIHYSPPEKVAMGIIPPENVKDFGDVLGNTSVILYPHEWGGKGIQVTSRKIPTQNEWVHVSVNSANGSGYNQTGGNSTTVYVWVGTQISRNQQLYLIDATPQTPDNWFDAELIPGMSLQHTTVPGFSIRNDGPALTNQGRGVRVTFSYNPNINRSSVNFSPGDPLIEKKAMSDLMR